MSAAQRRSPLAAPGRPRQPAGPHWRALLEARWRARLQEVTELSMAYAVASSPEDPGTSESTGTPGGARPTDGTSTADGAGPARAAGGCPDARSLLNRAVAARRKLADVEEALGRLAAGTFGRCEQCGSAIGPQLLSLIPEARYCPPCAAGPRPAAWC